MFAVNLKNTALLLCFGSAVMATSQSAMADLSAVSSFGFNWGGQTYVGGWVKNEGQLNYRQSQGRHVELWFYYPSNHSYVKVMDETIIDIPSKQTRAFWVPINPYTIYEQPIPILTITPAITDINPFNDGTFETVWLGSF